jgi:streptogrisin C
MSLQMRSSRGRFQPSVGSPSLGAGNHDRSWIIGVATVLAVLTLAVISQTASAATLAASSLSLPVDPALTAAFVQGDGLTTSQAEQRIVLQQEGAVLNQELEETLGSNYAGVWFNHSTDRLAVGVVNSNDTAAINAAVSTAGAQNEVEDVPVQSSWSELVDSQSAVNSDLASLLKDREISTGLYTPNNAIVIDVSPDAPIADQERVHALLDEFPGVKIEVQVKPPQDFEINAQACTTEGGKDAHCDRPMRGATLITGIRLDWECSAGLLAKQGETYYMMTAGHCIVDEGGSNVQWIMYNSSDTPYGIGNSGGFVFGERYPNPGGTRDSGAIKINPTSYWHTELNAYAYAGSFSEAYPTLGINEPYVGLGLCHLGISTPNNGSGTNCGEVLRLHVSVTYSEGNTVNDITETSACAHPGDSGGPYYANNDA